MKTSFISVLFRTFLIFVMEFSVSVADAKLVVTETRCNLQRGIALTDGTLSLGWQMISSQNSESQSAYQIEIVDRESGRVVFDSKKTESPESQMVGVPALRRTSGSYQWHVRVWNKRGEVSEWSKYQTVLVVPQAIDAKWIGAITRHDAKLPEGRFPETEFKKSDFIAKWKDVDSLSSRSIIMRKSFAARNKRIQTAIVYVCGLGHYELDINGAKIGDSEFAPLWSDYDKTVYYNVYDVTSHVKRGGNALSVLLGNGFYNVQRLGRYAKLMTSFGAPSLLLKLEINYSDGSQQVIKSGSDWKYALSPATYNCIYGGESYDARQEQQGCKTFGFNDSGWKNAVCVEGPKGSLLPQTAPPVKIMEHFGVKSCTKIPADSLLSASKAMKRTVDKSAFVLDMGQNLAGFPEITVQGKSGQKVVLYVAERLKRQGICDQAPTGRPHYYEYTLKGSLIEKWHPRFSYYGYRYIQVEGAVMEGMSNPEALPVIKKIESCFVYDSAPEVSSFECSNSLFTRTHRLIERAERSNMQGVLTDCPHREKLGWLEQDHLCGPSLLYNYDLTTYIPKILRDMSDAQKPNGMIPTVAPQYVSFGNVFDDSPEWGSAAVILPFMYYDQYGDDTMIRQYYPTMCRYVDYLTSRSKAHILDFGLGDWYDYGPWVAGFSKNTSVELVATAHYIYDLQLIQRAAEMAGDRAAKTRYSSLLDSVTVAFNSRFYHADSCFYDTGSQAANALPLFLGLAGDHKDKVMASLVADIHAHGDRLTTGDVGNRYLFQSLARGGQNELLYKMFNHDEAPGYGFQLKFDATTLTEQWDPRKGSSWNHFMMGQIDEWLFATLCGIKNYPGTYGLKHLLIAPMLVGDLTQVKASTRSLYGNISVSLTKSALSVEIPVGSDAVILLPNGTQQHVNGGKYSFTF